MKKINTNKKKIFLIISLVSLLVAVSIGGYFYVDDGDNSSQISKVNEGAKDTSIDYSPPSEQVQKDTSEKKEEILKNSPSNNEPEAKNGSDIKPEIIYYSVYNGYVEVTASVPGIFEKSGTCTLNLSKGDLKKAVSKVASPNVNDMSCGLMKISTKDLPSGGWSATVFYKSNKYTTAKSKAVVVEIK